MKEAYNGVNVNDLHSIYLGFMITILSFFIYLGFYTAYCSAEINVNF